MAKKKSFKGASNIGLKDQILDSMIAEESQTTVRLKDLVIDPTLEGYLLSFEGNDAELYEMIKKDGRVLDTIKYFVDGETGQKIVLDGHRRTRILKQHVEDSGMEIPYSTEQIKGVSSHEDAKDWMDEYQGTRRNYSKLQWSFHRGKRYLETNQGHGGKRSSGQNDLLNLRERLARHFNTSESTIKRDAEFARGVLKIKEADTQLAGRILYEEIKVNKADIQKVGTGKLPLENLKVVEDRLELVEAPQEPEKQIAEPKTTEPKPKADRFNSWWEKEQKTVEKLVKKGDEQTKAEKLEELQQRQQRLQQLIERLT